MSLIKKILLFSIIFLITSLSKTLASDLKKIGKFKDWEVMVVTEALGKVCFAQSIPVLQAPKKDKRDARLFVTFRPSEKISDEISTTSGYEFNKNNSVLAASGNNKFKFDIKQQGFAWMTSNKKEKRDSRLFVTFRPNEKISDEISTTSGYEFNKNNTVLAASGNNKFKFDIKQQGFAWMTSNKKEKIMIKVMKKGSRIMVTGYNEKGSQTIDHYSLLGFTKAYGTAKKACS